MGGKSCGRHSAGYIGARADLRFVIGDPVADFELQHLAPPIGGIETERGIQGVRRLLIVLKHEMSACGGDRRREPNTQSSTSNIDLVDSLVADLTVSRIPDSVPG